MCGFFSLIARLGFVEFCIVFVAEHGVGVQGDFGVKNVNSVVWGQNQGVDFDKVCVALNVGIVELQHDVDGTLNGFRVEVGSVYPGSRCFWG